MDWNKTQNLEPAPPAKMSLKQFWLLKLMEEAAEVAQRASKQMQYGSNEVQEGQELSNRQRLTDEIIDFVIIAHHLDQLGELDMRRDTVLVEEKRMAKVNKYLKYAQELGFVADR